MDIDLVQCIIKIQKMDYIPYHLKSSNSSNYEEARNKLMKNFYRVVNRVVELGGTVNLNKYRLESEVRLVSDEIPAVVPVAVIEELKKHPAVIDIQVIQTPKK